MVWYMYGEGYGDDEDDEFIGGCEGVGGEFIVRRGLCGVVVVRVIGLMIWD